MTSKDSAETSPILKGLKSAKSGSPDNVLASKDPIRFDWENKWLKGEEYAHMLRNIDQYCSQFKIARLAQKSHPPKIYTEPENGMIYFVEGNSVGSDFGFPRVDTKKRYRWKKMNFTTDLPKKRPFVTYIVASAVKCEKFFPDSKNEGPSYRMHAVILNKDGQNTQKYKSKGHKDSGNEESGKRTKGKDSQNKESKSVDEEDDDEEVGNENINSSNFQQSQALRAHLLQGPDDGKSYILCHIRKIDQNYKVTKPNEKRKMSAREDDEEGTEEEEEEENKENESVDSRSRARMSSHFDIVQKKIQTLQETDSKNMFESENSFSSFKKQPQQQNSNPPTKPKRGFNTVLSEILTENQNNILSGNQNTTNSGGLINPNQANTGAFTKVASSASNAMQEEEFKTPSHGTAVPRSATNSGSQQQIRYGGQSSANQQDDKNKNILNNEKSAFKPPKMLYSFQNSSATPKSSGGFMNVKQQQSSGGIRNIKRVETPPTNTNSGGSRGSSFSNVRIPMAQHTSHDMALINSAMKDNSENFDYFKLFNMLISSSSSTSATNSGKNTATNKVSNDLHIKNQGSQN